MHGHIEKKGQNWYLVLERERDEEGERNRVTISVRKELGLNKPATKRQAQDLLVRKIRELQEGTFIEPNDMTVADLLAQWMRIYGKANLRESTYATNESLIENHIVPHIGRIPLSKLKPMHIQSLLSEKLSSGRADGRKGGLSASSVEHIYRVLHTALEHAVKWELVTRNVADLVTPPSVKQSPPKVWQSAEAKRFLAHVAGHRLYPLYFLALSTGMRRGEILGLRWSDIDWDRKSISISQALVATTAGRTIISDTKTDASRRVVAISPAVLAELRKHRKRQLEELLVLQVKPELVFLSEAGTPMNPRNLLRHFQTTSKQAGIPVIPFHGLRHTCATMMLQAGVHPKVVSERLGHSKIGITLDIYSHVLPDMQEEAAQLLENTLKG